MRRAGVRSLIGLVVCASSFTFVTMPRAHASGDAGLNRLIIRDPGTEWTPAPKSVENQLVTLERNLVSSVVNGRVSVAARAWQHGDDRLLVVLIATNEPLPSGKQQGRSAVLSMCASATSNPPSSIGTFSSIPGASEAVCTGKNPSGKELHGVGVAWTKKNVFVIMGGTMSLSNAEALAIRQNKAIPSSGVSPAIDA